MGRSHSHRPSPQKIAQRERQAAYGAAWRERKRQERARERAERDAAEQAIYDPAPPPAPPAPEPEELLRCANCETERPASEYTPAAAARIRRGRSAWCERCHNVRLLLLLTPHGRRVAEEVRPARVRHLGSRDA